MLKQNQLLKVSLGFFIFFMVYTPASNKLHAQLCTGSLGDPVVNITFGSGNDPGGPLPDGITNYQYVAVDCPQDGEYTIKNHVAGCFSGTWHDLTQDHTGNPNGYFMLVNASFAPSDFYVQKVDGLCGNTTYEFAAWILNICEKRPSILPNITFTIENLDGSIIQTVNTGDIPATATPEWKQYGFYFTTAAKAASVILRMTNNAPGGIGNDLALDDITFRPCGAKISAGINGSISNYTSFCEGDTAVLNFSAFVSPGYNNPAFQWQLSRDSGISWADIPGATSTNLRRTPTASGNYWYRLSVAESGNMGIASCRVASNLLTVVVHPKPKIQLHTNAPVCSGTVLNLQATVSNYSLPVWKSSWTYPDLNPVVLKSDSIINSNSVILVNQLKSLAASGGPYHFSIVDSFGCTASDSTVVKIWPNPVADFNFPLISCQNQDVHFVSNASGTFQIAGWYWNFGDGSTSNINNPVHVFNSTGNYLTRLSVTDINGCTSDTVSKLLNAHALPHPGFIMPGICLTDPYAQFTDTSSISDNSQNQFTYRWNFGEPSSGPTNYAQIKNPQHSYAAAATYLVNLSITSVDGCTNDTTKLFTVNGAVPKAAFSLQNTGVICSSDSVRLFNNATVDLGNIVKVAVWWNYPNTPAAQTTDQEPYPGKIYAHDYADLMDSASKTFQIHYTVYSGISCFDQTEQTIVIDRSPVVQLNTMPAVCVENPPFALHSGTETTGAQGLGSYSGVGVNSDSIFAPGQAGPGLHTIQYQFLTSAGCAAGAQQNIMVFDHPKANAGPDATIVKGSFTYLHGTATGDSVSYVWYPASFLSSDRTLDPKAAPVTDVAYILKVTSVEGCTNLDTVNIKVLNGFYIPNAFTPNNDGLNDLWRLPALDAFPNAEAWIYNRWGQVIFHAKAPVIAWDGKSNGKMATPGTYVYMVDLKNGMPVFKGTLILIK